MARRKKQRRKKKTAPFEVIAVSIMVIIAFSLVVRWSGAGAGYSIDAGAFQLEVLNGTGETGLAMETAMRLRKMGVDVLIVDDAERYDFEESILIDRRGNPALMKKLSRSLGVRRVLQQVQQKPLVDATLILGGDARMLRIER